MSGRRCSHSHRDYRSVQCAYALLWAGLEKYMDFYDLGISRLMLQVVRLASTGAFRAAEVWPFT